MNIEFDPDKRDQTLQMRGLDFADAAAVFSGDTLDLPDGRFEYGEERIVSFGLLGDLVVAIVWTKRADIRRIISMRKASRDERAYYWGRMG